MRRSEAGYATVTVAALSGALSVIALAIMNLSTSRAQLGLDITTQLQTDAKLEGVLHSSVASLVHRKTTFEEFSEGAMLDFEGAQFRVMVEHEGDKLNLNTAEFSEIGPVLARSGLTSKAQRDYLYLIRTKRRTDGTPFLGFKELSLENQNSAWDACLRRAFTLYQTPRPLSNSARKGRDGLDGLYLRFLVETIDRSRGLDATVLLTGNSQDPMWVFDFTRFYPRERGACGYEEAS